MVLINQKCAINTSLGFFETASPVKPVVWKIEMYVICNEGNETMDMI
jgi:hypothetical protein